MKNTCGFWLYTILYLAIMFGWSYIGNSFQALMSLDQARAHILQFFGITILWGIGCAAMVSVKDAEKRIKELESEKEE